MLQLLLLPGYSSFRSSLRRFQPGNDGFLGYCAADRIRELNSILIDSLRQQLFERSAVLGVGGFGGDDIVFRGGEISFLLQDIRRCRRSQSQLFLLRLVGLEVELAGGQRSLHCGPVVGQRKLSIDDLNANLNIELLQAHFCLAVFKKGASLQRLCGAVANRDIYVNAHSLIGTGALEEVAEDCSVTHGGYIAGRGAKELRRAKGALGSP